MEDAEKKLWLAVISQAVRDLGKSKPVKVWGSPHSRNEGASADWCAKCFLTKDILDPKSIPGQILAQYGSRQRLANWAKQIGHHTCKRDKP